MYSQSADVHNIQTNSNAGQETSNNHIYMRIFGTEYKWTEYIRPKTTMDFPDGQAITTYSIDTSEYGGGDVGDVIQLLLLVDSQTTGLIDPWPLGNNLTPPVDGTRTLPPPPSPSGPDPKNIQRKFGWMAS